jgi:tRNA(Ile)-lysidine synthase
VITKKNLDDFIGTEIEEGQKELRAASLYLTFSTQERRKFTIPLSKNIACLDLSKLKFPLQIRKWQEGDWFCPLGMNKKKKISDFLIDQKVPLNLKGATKVLVSGGSIAWVIGQRVDDRFKISEETEKILVITKENI